MNIKVDSRKVKEGDIFVAIKGINHDGNDYIEEAIKNGATTVVVEKGLYSVDTLIVKDTKEYLIKYLKENYYDKIKNLKLIGITGTNGKTTSCYLLYQSLNKLNKKCAYIGTIGFYIEDSVTKLNNTTPDILDIYEMLLECARKNCEYVVMEVSSHALSLKRVEGLLFDYVVFTNLTKDHLDYHKNMEYYALAKKNLFIKLKENGKAIINIDDKYHDYFLLDSNSNITYGINSSNYQIKDYQVNESGSVFNVFYNNKNNQFKTNLIGKYNIYNTLISIIILNEIGYYYDDIYKIISELSAPKGRMEVVKYNDNLIIIDYAHTPDAVLKIIKTVKQLSKNKIYTIIGCGGNRDKTKRPEMAKIATELSDFVVFTSDNPRDENPNDIIDDMIRNLEYNNYEIIINRKEAIEKSIQMLTKSDILLVLGKGHEDYQIINGKKIDFDDKKVVLEIIGR